MHRMALMIAVACLTSACALKPATDTSTSKPSDTSAPKQSGTPISKKSDTSPPNELLDVRQVLDKAIEAHGGRKRIQQAQIGRMKRMGKVHLPFGTMNVSTEEYFDYPRRLRKIGIDEFAGQKNTTLLIINEQEAWMKRNDSPTQEMQSLEVANVSYISCIQNLIAYRDGGFSLTSIGESQIEGRPSIGIRAMKDDVRLGDLYFDKSLSLLLKVRVDRPQLSSKQMGATESLYYDHKDAKGVKIPTRLRVYEAARLVVEEEVVELEFLDKLDGGIFAKP